MDPKRKIHPWIEDSTQYHLPFHNYLGPGTHVVSNMLSGVEPVNVMDRIAMFHDYDYLSGMPQQEADALMTSRLTKVLPLGKFNPVAPVVWAAFKAKDVVGYNPETSPALAKEIAQTDFFKAQKSLLDAQVAGIAAKPLG